MALTLSFPLVIDEL